MKKNLPLVIERYNHCRLSQIPFEIEDIDFLMSQDRKYAIIENDVFDLSSNKNLGKYYDLKSRQILTESWLETLADIGIGVTSAALDATGVGSVAAKAIDFFHALSFIYRGETRNDIILKLIGFFSLGTLAIPGLGSSIKGVIMGIAKTFIGKPIAFLIKALAKNKIILKVISKFKDGIPKITGYSKQFGEWAKQFGWFGKVWNSIAQGFTKGLEFFKGFLDDVVKAAGGKVGQTALTTGGKTGQLALTTGSKAGQAALTNIAKTGEQKALLAIEQMYARKFSGVLSKKQFDIALRYNPKMVEKLSSKFFKKPEMLESSLAKLASNAEGAAARVLAKNQSKALAIIEKPISALIPVTTSVIKKTGLPTIQKGGQRLVRVLKPNKVTGKMVGEYIPFTNIAKGTSKLFKISKEWRAAAAGLIGIGLGGMLFADAAEGDIYIIPNEEINDIGGDVVGEPTKEVRKRAGDPYEYQVQNGKWHTRKKGSEGRWIDISKPKYQKSIDILNREFSEDLVVR